jgi:hypothetical protein
MMMDNDHDTWILLGEDEWAKCCGILEQGGYDVTSEWKVDDKVGPYADFDIFIVEIFALI